MIVLTPEELFKIINDTTAVAETAAFKKVIDALTNEASTCLNSQSEGLSMAKAWLEKNRSDILNLRVSI